MEQTSDSMPALARALAVLEELARSGSELTFTDLCEFTNTPKATMHRLLGTLQHRGYISQGSTGRYSAGVRCFELGSMWAQKLDLRSVAAPFLLQLNELSQETVHLGVYEYGDVIYIDRLESPKQVIAKSYVGRRCTAVCVATGRVLLAYSDNAEMERVLAEPLPAYTAQSIVEPQQMRDMLMEVRSKGYAINRCSYRDEVSGIAAPIRDHTGRVVASVGLCLPEHRFSEDCVPLLRDLTMQAGADISEALGGAAVVLPSGHRDAPAFAPQNMS